MIMSPKRKRAVNLYHNDMMDVTSGTSHRHLMPLNTFGIAQSTSDPDSPRSRIAEHLQSLDLHHQHDHDHSQKRLQPMSTAVMETSLATPPKDVSIANCDSPQQSATHDMDNLPEICETPDAYSLNHSHDFTTTASLPLRTNTPADRQPRALYASPTKMKLPSSPPPSPSPWLSGPLSLRTADEKPTAIRKKASIPPPITSAPPTTPISSPNETENMDLGDAALSMATLPPQESSTESLDQDMDHPAVTPDNQQTHTEPAQPRYDDDDDETENHGLNGLGFRPTPAIARKRQEWRKRQISEWRAREAAEARGRRFKDRRKRGCDGDDIENDSRDGGRDGRVVGDGVGRWNGAMEKRVRVRFAETA